jgi:hypothetical protein
MLVNLMVREFIILNPNNSVVPTYVSNQNLIKLELGNFSKKFTFGNDVLKSENGFFNKKVNEDIFKIDKSALTDKKDFDSEFKEKLKMLVEIEAPKISESISDAIESDNKDELIRTLKKLKSTAAICYYNDMVLKIEEWCKIINTKSSLKDIDKHLDMFDLTLDKMTDEAKSVINEKSTITFKNEVSSINQPKIAINKEVINSPGNKKILLNQSSTSTNQPAALSSYLISKGNEEDNILLELKPLKFDGLFRKDLTEDEIAEEIKKISESKVKDQNFSENKSRFPKQANKPVTDNSYPFEQESFKISCLII